MPKRPNDYIDMDLSRLYEQEQKRKKMCELAKESMEVGKSLNSPELLRESSSFNQLMIDEGVLKQISKQMEQEEASCREDVNVITCDNSEKNNEEYEQKTKGVEQTD